MNSKKMTKTQEKKKVFKFKNFEIKQDQCTMKVGTDGVILGAIAPIEGVNSILDIGSGSGLICLMLAQRANKATVVGVEVEANAYKQSVENGQNSPWKKRVHFENESIQDYSKFSDQSFDLIVSNPPFFSGGTFSYNQERNNVRHTIKLPNGDLLQSARKLLNKGGKFVVILPVMEGLRFKDMAKTYRLFCTEEIVIKGKESKSDERLVLIFEQEETNELKNSKLIVYNEDESYHSDFIALTKDFYLNF